MTLTSEEVAMLLVLVSKLNPDNFPHPQAKALIYKAKAATLNTDNLTLRIIE